MQNEICLQQALKEGKRNSNQGHLQDWNEMQVMPLTSQVMLGAFINMEWSAFTLSLSVSIFKMGEMLPTS